MNMKDSNNEIKYPKISKVVMCVFAIFEANGSVERLFSQISHIVGKDRNRQTLDNIKGHLHSKGICMDAKIDDKIIYNVIAAHTRMVSKKA